MELKLKWKPIDEDLYNVPYGAHVYIYYKDIQYDRYDIIVERENNFFSSSNWRSLIDNSFSNKKATLYIIVPLPEIPDEYKPSGGRFDETGGLIPVKDWR